VRVLGAGSLAFGVLGLVRPARLARMMAIGEDAARIVGFRDTGSALALFASADKRLAVVQRMLFDAGDAALLARRRPGAAVAALAFGCLGAAALARL
jgi:hypothetical protein